MFSQKLKDLRIRENISQIEFAKEIDYSQAAISAWENGTREPGLEALVRIAQFFNVTVDYLLSEETISTYAPRRIEMTDLPEEKELLCTYRRLPNDLKRRANAYMKSLLSLLQAEEETKKQRKL